MPSPSSSAPSIELQPDSTVCLRGAWQVHQLAQAGVADALLTTLKKLPTESNWDLSQLTALDHIGAQLLWRVWGDIRPNKLNLTPQNDQFFERLKQTGKLILPPDTSVSAWSISALNLKLYQILDHLTGFIGLIGQLMLDLARFARKPLQGPWKEISANVFHAGYQALGIT
ncbi:MAG: ABC transporter permease, partial [Herbaspirillum sp.]